MAGTNEEVVKDVDVVHIEPAGKDAEDIDDTEETDPESTQEETGDESEDDESEDKGKPDALSQRQTTPPAEGAKEPADDKGKDDDLAEIEGETPRERALRLELTNQRRINRQLRGEDLGISKAPPAQAGAKKELTPEKAAVLGKYKPEEIQALKEVFPVLAEEMGFVRQDELAGTNYAERAQESLDNFLEKHPEYTPEKDPDGTLWNAFKAEYGMYKQPSNPKDFAKIFDRIHRDVFGIRPKGDLKTVNAGKEKARVASHAGASSAPAAPRAQRAAAPQGLRVDMLKGFTDEEKAELLGDD